MPRENFLPYFLPTIGPEEIDAVVNTLKSGWITTGEKSHKFEKAFIEHLGVKFALGLNSCTAALHLSLLLLKIKPGDEVITTPFTFIATANVIEHLGAKPIFVDIEPDTLNIDPQKIKHKINKNTKAILIVHYGGHSCDMEAIMEISDQYHLPIIEDVAHGVGGSYQGKKLGTFGTFSAFSFYANKNITTIEGGMLVGNESAIKQARIMSLHGIDRDAWKRYREDGSWYYEVVYPGLKYNMTDVSASIGIEQLKKLDVFQEKRCNIVEKYNNAFKCIASLEIPTQRANVQHAWFNYPLRLNLTKLNINRDNFINELHNLKIGTSVHFIPVHIHPYYKDKYNFSENDLPITYKEYLRILSIPIYPKMTEEDINDVIEAVLKISEKYGI